MFGVFERKGRGGGAPCPQSVLLALRAGCASGQLWSSGLRCPEPAAAGGPSSCLSASRGTAQPSRDPSQGHQEGLGQAESQVAWSCRAMPREAPVSLVLQQTELQIWSPAGLSGSSCSAWCWVLGPRHRGQSWGAAATRLGRAPCPAARVLAREALPMQGGVHGAGALGNEMGFFASVHIGCRGASCGSCPGLRSVSLGGSKASAWEHSLQSSGRNPETAAGAVCPGGGSIISTNHPQTLRAPPPPPKASGAF